MTIAIMDDKDRKKRRLGGIKLAVIVALNFLVACVILAWRL
jgi:hypothetical protein